MIKDLIKIKVNRKGQMTIFVIIGIIILIGVGMIISYNKTSSERLLSEELHTKVVEIPLMFQPINDYVESCIAKTGKEGIKLIGIHGGYIDLEEYDINYDLANPTEGDSFLFNARDSNSGIAYWHYFKSENECEENCECASKKPPLHKSQGLSSVEEQLSDYMNEKLPLCLDSFKDFETIGFEIEEDMQVKSNVLIKEKEIAFHVKYKITAKKDETEFVVDEFLTSVPVEFMKMYEMAEQITKMQMNNTKGQFLEKWAMEQVAAFGMDVDTNSLPPMSYSNLDPSDRGVFWVKYNVQENIRKNMLPVYTSFLNVVSAKNYNEDLVGTFYERALLPVYSPSNYSFKDLDVTFSYLDWWPIYFDITGRGIKGQIIGPEKTPDYMAIISTLIKIKRYEFYYDISYPVLIDIYNKEAFNNEGMHFYFGLEANVRNNKPINCSGPGKTEYAPGFYGSLICNDNQGCAEVEIFTTDKKTSEPLVEVEVKYSTSTQGCSKGQTELQNGIIADKAVLEAKLPQCVGAGCALTLSKQGYMEYTKSYSVLCNKVGGKCDEDNILCNNDKLEIELVPYRNPNIQVKIKRMQKLSEKSWAFDNTNSELLDNEYAIVTMEKFKEDPQEKTLSVASIVEGTSESVNFYPGLIPGKYKTSIMLFYKLPDYKARTNVTFVEKEECEEYAGDFVDVITGGTEEECYTIGPYTYSDDVLQGGFEGNLTITKQMLDDYDTLTLYAFSVPDIDKNFDSLDAYDINEWGNIEKYSKENYVQLKPHVSNTQT
jgi:hypothetical protein